MTEAIINSERSKEIFPLINNAIERELAILKLSIEKTKSNLKKFEEKHKMKTELFYKKYEKGEIEDNDEFIEWSGEYETLKLLERNYKELKEVKLCS